jgi:hypothetical protein
MESSNTNDEDKNNEGNINIPLATSSLERKKSEYIATQTQVLQAIAQTISPLKSKLHSLKTTILSPMITIKT